MHGIPNQLRLARLTCSVALVALASGAVASARAVVVDRGARQSRLGGSRSANSGPRFDVAGVDGHFVRVEVDPRLSYSATSMGGGNAKTTTRGWNPLPLAAHTPSDRPALIAPQRGAYVPFPDSLLPLSPPLVSHPNRGPPTP